VNFLLQIDLQNIIYPDSEGYHDAAKSLYLHAKGQNCRPILLAIIQGFPYIFGASDSIIFSSSFYINLFCWLGFSIVLFEISKNYFSLKTSFVLAIFPFFIFNNLVVVFHLLSENVFMFFTILGIYFLMKYRQSRQFWQLSLSLAIFVSSMLIRPGAKFFAIIMVLFFIKIVFINYRHKATFLLYGSLMMVLVQCAGLKHQFGHFRISYIDVITYHNYLGSRAMCLKNGIEYSQYNNPRAEYIYNYQSEFQVDIAAEDFKNQLRDNKTNLIKAYFIDILDNSKSGSGCVSDCKNIKKTTYFASVQKMLYHFTTCQNSIFSVIGFLIAVFFFFKFKKVQNLQFYFSIYILYTITTAGISCQQGDRFHAVLFPYILFLILYYLKYRTVNFEVAAPPQK
jgi:hypothetical protein